MALRKGTPEYKEYMKDYQLRRRQEVKLWYNAIKAKLFCEGCGFNHPAALNFHHLDPSTKYKSISEMVRDAHTPASIQAEMDKCAILCANCHLILHWEERQDGTDTEY